MAFSTRLFIRPLKDEKPNLAKFIGIFLLFMLFVGLVSATEIRYEREVIDLGDPTHVRVEINYSDLSSNQVSTLVPRSHRPTNVEASDVNGPVSCEYVEEDSEILCSPGRVIGTYFISINYTTSNPALSEREYRSLRHAQRILVPTGGYSLKVVLPEGYGTADLDEVEPYTPAPAETTSEGRRISIEWNDREVSLGDTLRFEVNYQELQVFGDVFPSRIALLVAVVLVVVAVLVTMYMRRRMGEKDTIAAILPILKEDEQEVLRFIIDQEGECEQKAVVENLDYSKAKISRLVKDLSERNLVEKVKEGRKNRLVLKKEIGDVRLKKKEE